MDRDVESSCSKNMFFWRKIYIWEYKTPLNQYIFFFNTLRYYGMPAKVVNIIRAPYDSFSVQLVHNG